MKNKVLSLDQALEHLQGVIEDREGGKPYVIAMMKWIIDFDRTLPDNSHIFCYLRETINIAFALDREGNMERTRKPNFCVIKLSNTDRQFRELHLDFDLSKRGEAPYRDSLERRLFNKGIFRENRWVLLGSKMDSLGLDGIKDLLLKAFERKGGRQ
jgi:hypothetical protein